LTEGGIDTAAVWCRVPDAVDEVPRVEGGCGCWQSAIVALSILVVR
jgi:hypothetical protein